MNDPDIVRAQIGRPPRSQFDVVAACHLGLPVVIAVPPFLDDGTPFPTRYWLTCPLAGRRIGRVESRGGVKAAERLIASDPEFAARYRAAMERYEAERDSLIPPDMSGPRPSGGVGGTRTGVKCLHAHYADHASGHDNPVGESIVPAVEPLNCATACVADHDGVVERNRDWREPRA